MTRQCTEDLRAARDLLMPPGAWCKEFMYEKDRHGNIVARCVMGAIHTVCKGIVPGSWDQGRIQACNVMLKSCLPKDWSATQWTVAEYQDHPRRTKTQILALIDRAIAKAEKFND